VFPFPHAIQLNIIEISGFSLGLNEGQKIYAWFEVVFLINRKNEE
jgi:hypothetical protein